MTFREALMAAVMMAAVLGAVFFCLRRVLLWARKQNKRAYVIGAALAPFIALGNVVDPEFRIVNEAKQHKKREEDEPGDPPNDEDEPVADRRSDPVAPPVGARRLEKPVPRTSNTSRPAAVWAVALVLGGMAVLTSLVQTWLLFADAENVTSGTRAVLPNFGAFEWASLYFLQVVLLAAMVMLLRLRKSAIWLFATYLCVGVALSAWYALGAEPLAPPVVTAFGASVGLIVLGYMARLRWRGQLR